MLHDKGVELINNGSYRESITAFQEVLRPDPQNTSAPGMIDQAETSLCREYYRKVAPPSKTPYFLIPEIDLKRCALTHEEGFIASRINGTWNIPSIVTISPLRKLQILEALEKLLQINAIALK